MALGTYRSSRKQGMYFSCIPSYTPCHTTFPTPQRIFSLRRKEIIAYTMLQTLKRLHSRPLTSSIPSFTTKLSRTMHSKSILSPPRPTAHCNLNTKLLAFPRVQYVKPAAEHPDPETQALQDDDPMTPTGTIIFLGTFIAGCIHWKQRREEREEWMAVFKVPSYKSWIGTKNLCFVLRTREKKGGLEGHLIFS